MARNRQKKPNKVLFRIGVAMIILGVVLLFIGLPIVNQSSIAAKTPAGSIEVTGISSTSATLITSGFILIVLGLSVVGVAFKFGK
jgi:hypothetical protein